MCIQLNEKYPHLSTALVQMGPKYAACLFPLAFDVQTDVYLRIKNMHKVLYLDTSIDQVWASNARGNKHATLNLHYGGIFSTFCSCANGSQIWCMLVAPRVWCSNRCLPTYPKYAQSSIFGYLHIPSLITKREGQQACNFKSALWGIVSTFCFTKTHLNERIFT